MSHKTYKIETGDKTYCDDHYCTGHIQRVVECECGKVLYSSEQSIHENRDNIRLKHIEHRLDEAGL